MKTLKFILFVLLAGLVGALGGQYPWSIITSFFAGIGVYHFCNDWLGIKI